MTLREFKDKLNRVTNENVLDLPFIWNEKDTEQFHGDSKITPYTFLTDDGKLGHMGSLSCGPILEEDL